MRTTTTTTTTQLVLLLTSLVFPLLALAQFGQFFEQMFHGDRSHHHHHHQHHHHNQREQDVASDAAWYRKMYDSATCSKYLCHETLSCVDKPTHCPCAFAEVEEKFELHPEGLAVCLSKSFGGAAGVNVDKVRQAIKSGGLSDTARKIDLARKGLL